MSATQDFVRKQSTGDPFTKLVLRTIADYANWETGSCFPSIETLAADCEASESTVRRRLQDLQIQGFITIQVQNGRPNVITLVGYAEWFASLPVRSFDRGVPQTGVSGRQGGVSHSNQRGVHGTPEISNRNISINIKGVDSSTTNEVDGGEDHRVWFSGGQIKLCDQLNSFWLKQFNGQQDDLNLALLQIAAYVQPNNVHGLEKQVSSQLAKIARERRERDKRYQNSKNPPASREVFQNGPQWVRVQRGTPDFEKWVGYARSKSENLIATILEKTGYALVPHVDPQTAWEEFITTWRKANDTRRAGDAGAGGSGSQGPSANYQNSPTGRPSRTAA